MKRLLTGLALASSTLHPLRAELSPGDIALVGLINNGAPDSFAIMTLAPLPAGQVVYFTDNGWTGSAFRNTSASQPDGDGNENLMKFTAVTAIAAGTIIRSSDTGAAFTWTTSGPIPGAANGNFNFLSLSAAGEQIYAFTAPAILPLQNPAVFLSVLDDTGAFEPATGTNTGDVPPGLSPGSTALTFNHPTANVLAFNPSVLSSGTKAQWLVAIGDPDNWTAGAAGSLPSGSFVVVPEPGSAALLTLGAFTVFSLRRRGRA